MTWHDMTWYVMTWHDMTWYVMTWHDMILYHTVFYHIFCNIAFDAHTLIHPSLRAEYSGKTWQIARLLMRTPIFLCYYIRYKLWDEITYAFPNFNSATVEVRKWIFHPTIYQACNCLSMLGLKLKGPPVYCHPCMYRLQGASTREGFNYPRPERIEK